MGSADEFHDYVIVLLAAGGLAKAAHGYELRHVWAFYEASENNREKRRKH